MWANHWAWQRLTRSAFEQQVQRGQVLGVRQDGVWRALAIALLEYGGQHIGYADGAGESLSELARSLSARAWQNKANFNLALLPPSPELALGFEQAGYAPDDGGSAMLIYEMDL